jgi:hypothetical protein
MMSQRQAFPFSMTKQHSAFAADIFPVFVRM